MKLSMRTRRFIVPPRMTVVVPSAFTDNISREWYADQLANNIEKMSKRPLQSELRPA